MSDTCVCIDLSPLCTSSRFRGHGSYALGLARALARSPQLWDGLELRLLAGWGPWLSVVPCSPEAVERAASRPGPLLADEPYYLVKKTLGRLQLARHRASLFHATDPKGNPHPRAMATVATCHDLIPVLLRYPFSPPLLPALARLPVERRRYRAFDHVIAVSETTRQDLLRLCQLPEDKVTVVHHGVDARRYHPAAATGERKQVARLLGTDRPYFLYLGGFDRRKQVPLLVEALARTSALDEVLVLAGRAGARQRAALEEQAHGLGLNGRVLLTGELRAGQLPALYRQATAHLLLSSYEGFGMTITEAFACGCPVLALAQSCIPEIAGEAALLLPEAEPDAVAAAMERLSREAELRERLRQAGLARAALFTWERCAAQTVAVYRRLLARGRSGRSR